MDFMDLLESSGGGSSIGALTKMLGVSGGDAGKLVNALGPALARGLQKQTEQPDSMAGLTKALASGKHQRYLDNPESLTTEESRADGNKILGHLFGSKDVSRKVADEAAKSTGIESGLIKKALPMLAGLAMAALSKKEQSGSSEAGGLGGLLGSLLGGGDGFGLDDMMSIAKKLF